MAALEGLSKSSVSTRTTDPAGSGEASCFLWVAGGLPTALPVLSSSYFLTLRDAGRGRAGMRRVEQIDPVPKVKSGSGTLVVTSKPQVLYAEL